MMNASNPSSRATSVYGRPLYEVAAEIGKHPATMHRWRNHGVLDAGGIRRSLKMTKMGGYWYVTDHDLAAFFAALGGEPCQSQIVNVLMGPVGTVEPTTVNVRMSETVRSEAHPSQSGRRTSEDVTRASEPGTGRHRDLIGLDID